MKKKNETVHFHSRRINCDFSDKSYTILIYESLSFLIQIIKKLKDEKIKIIVSIDDIDRLSDEEIVAVFQLVKSLADFPNTIYVLAFDYDVVVRALGKVQHGDGKE